MSRAEYGLRRRALLGSSIDRGHLLGESAHPLKKRQPKITALHLSLSFGILPPDINGLPRRGRLEQREPDQDSHNGNSRRNGDGAGFRRPSAGAAGAGKYHCLRTGSADYGRR
jgi:hypothetical protein